MLPRESAASQSCASTYTDEQESGTTLARIVVSQSNALAPVSFRSKLRHHHQLPLSLFGLIIIHRTQDSRRTITNSTCVYHDGRAIHGSTACCILSWRAGGRALQRRCEIDFVSAKPKYLRTEQHPNQLRPACTAQFQNPPWRPWRTGQ